MRPQEAAARDVSREVAAEGEQAVLGRHHRLVGPPLALRNDAVLVEVDEVEVLAARGVRFRLRDAAVLVGILRREPLGVARQLQVLARLVERAAVADDEDAAAVEHGARLHLGRQAVREPGDVARAEVVRVEPEGARQHDQVPCPRPLEQDRRRVPRERARARRAPALAAGPGVERGDEGARRLVAREHHQPAGQDRRGAHAVDVVERAERRAPQLAALVIVGDEAVVAEERHHALGVGRRARGGGSVAAVERLAPRARDLAPPQLAAVAFPEADEQQPLALVAREVEALAQQHGRGVAGGHGHAPDRLVGSERARQRPIVRDAVAVRAAEAGPVGGAERGSGQEREHAERPPHVGSSRGRLSA